MSLVVFAAVAGAGVRSLWSLDLWESGNGRWGIVLAGGRAHFNHMSGLAAQYPPTGHVHVDVRPNRSDIAQMVWGFRIDRDTLPFDNGRYSILHTPIWPLLLLLLIVPVRWLIARPACASAFPVIANANQR